MGTHRDSNSSTGRLEVSDRGKGEITFLILKWAFFIGIMIFPKIPMKNRGYKMRNLFFAGQQSERAISRCVRQPS